MSDPEPGDVVARTERYFIHSVRRGLSLIESFDPAHPRLTLDEVSARSGISRSAARRLLLTLVDLGYLSTDGHLFWLMPRLLDLGYVQQSRLSLADIARPHCEALSTELDRNVALAVLDGQDVRFLLRCGAPRIMSVALNVGSRLPAHLTAVGRALLAWLSEDELARHMKTLQMTSQTARSVTSVERLRATLMQVRADGYAVVEQELEEGLSAIAAPVRDRSGRIVAAVNVSTQASGRALTHDELPAAAPALLRTIAQIGLDTHPMHIE